MADTNNMTERTYMRLTPEEKKKLAEEAAQMGVGESTYLRMVFFGRTKDEEKDEEKGEE